MEKEVKRGERDKDRGEEISEEIQRKRGEISEEIQRKRGEGREKR